MCVNFVFELWVVVCVVIWDCRVNFGNWIPRGGTRWVEVTSLLSSSQWIFNRVNLMLLTKGACNVPLTKTAKHSRYILNILQPWHHTLLSKYTLSVQYAWESMRMVMYFLNIIYFLWQCTSDNWGLKCTLCKYNKHIWFPNAIHNKT